MAVAGEHPPAAPEKPLDRPRLGRGFDDDQPPGVPASARRPLPLTSHGSASRGGTGECPGTGKRSGPEKRSGPSHRRAVREID